MDSVDSAGIREEIGYYWVFNTLRHTVRGAGAPGNCMALKQMAKGSIAFFVLSLLLALPHLHAQAALFMEEPYGIYGAVNPTGHNAIYLANVCPETPVKLRRCHPGELGVVISRYEGIDGYDWVAIPLVPYLYSVENIGDVPTRVDHETVVHIRNRYREAHFEAIGLDKSGGSYVRDGWTQLIGAAYERRIYAFRFNTTPAQDDALIARLNARPNRSHFDMLFNNCADFARRVLNIYFPHTFRRSIFPDAGVTTPKQIAYKLVHYAHKHPEMELQVIEIPQIPGYSWHSHSTKGIAESLSTTAYAVPLTILNPYLAGGIFVDYLVRGRSHLVPKHPEVVGPENLSTLTEPLLRDENASGAAVQAPGAGSSGDPDPPAATRPNSGLKEGKAAHE